MAQRGDSAIAIDDHGHRGGRPDRPGFVLFDLYDTLVGFDRQLIRDERARIAAEMRTSVDALERAEAETMPARMVGAFGRDLRVALGEMLRVAGASVDRVSVSEFVTFELQTWEKAAVIYDDVVPSLRTLRRHGLRLGLLSNCCYLTPPLLIAWKLRSYFDGVILSCEVGCMKPKAQVLNYAIEAMHGHPENGLLVDDKQSCVEAARALGLDARRIARGQPTASGDTITDLTQLTDQLLAGAIR